MPWTTIPYATGWSDFGLGYGPPQYCKLANGLVMLRGLVKKAGGAGGNTVLTLPAGCRPAINEIFACGISYGTSDYTCAPYMSAAGVLTVQSVFTSGGVVPIGSGTVIPWLSLSGIKFMAA